MDSDGIAVDLTAASTAIGNIADAGAQVQQVLARHAPVIAAAEARFLCREPGPDAAEFNSWYPKVPQQMGEGTTKVVDSLGIVAANGRTFIDAAQQQDEIGAQQIRATQQQA